MADSPQAPNPRPLTPNPFVSGIVLAAGSSRRMGRPKQLLPLRGRPLLQHVIDAAAASRLDEIILVLGHHFEGIRGAIKVPRRMRVVVNAEFEEGQSSSLRIGLQNADARAKAAAILLGDQPQVPVDLIDRVIEAFGRHPARIVRPVFTSLDGRLPGHPVILSRSVWPDAMRISGDEGARSLMSTHPEWVRELPVDAEAPRDVDAPSDYEAL